MATYKAVLHHNKREDGTHLIQVRITKNRKHTYVSTEYYVEFKDWNIKKSEVRTSCRHFALYNAGIEKLIYNAREVEIKSFIQDKSITGKGIKRVMKGGESKSFKKHAEAYLLERNIKNRTNKKYKQHIGQWSEFAGDITLSQVEERTIREFVRHSYKSRGDNSINRCLVFLKSVYEWAQKEEGLSGINPFDTIKVKPKDGEVIRLIDKQLEAIENVKVSAKNQPIKDEFLLQYFLGGLRISDMITMLVDQVQGDMVIFTDIKTGRLQGHPIIPQAKLILDKYLKGKESGDYILPFMKYKKGHPRFDNQVDRESHKINEGLKEIVKAAGIKTKVTSHVARHSFAEQLRKSNVHISDIQSLLGHSDIQMTVRYMNKFDPVTSNEAFKRAMQK